MRLPRRFMGWYYSAAAALLLVIAGLLTQWWLAFWWLSLLLLWGAVSLLAVGIAYISQYPHLFRKREDGRIPLWISWLFWPFLAGAHLYNRYQRLNDSVPPLQEIKPEVFLGCRLFVENIAFLQEQNIGSVLDVTAEFSGLSVSAQMEDLHYLNIPVLDHQSPTQQQLHQAVNWMRYRAQMGDKVVVHCALGRGRSVLTLAAYLIAAGHADSPAQALEIIVGIRSTAGLNKSQLKALYQFCEQRQKQPLPRCCVVANPVSGGGKWGQHANSIVVQLGLHFDLSVFQTTEETGAPELTRKALVLEPQLVVAAGGDGTLREVAGELLNTDVPMAVMPLGTANALAHVLMGVGSKFSPVNVAVDAILQGTVQTIDTANCNDELMLLALGIGFEYRMIESSSVSDKKDSGQFAYINGFVKAVLKNESQTFRVSSDGDEPKQLDCSSLIVANAAPSTTLLAQGGGLPNISDGKLDITLLPESPDTSDQVMSLLELMLLSKPKELSNHIQHWQAAEITIDSDTPFGFAVDGEVRENKSLRVRCQPKSLKVYGMA